MLKLLHGENNIIIFLTHEMLSVKCNNRKIIEKKRYPMQSPGHQSERFIKIYSQLDPEKQKELERYARLLKKDDKLSALK